MFAIKGPFISPSKTIQLHTKMIQRLIMTITVGMELITIISNQREQDSVTAKAEMIWDVMTKNCCPLPQEEWGDPLRTSHSKRWGKRNSIKKEKLKSRRWTLLNWNSVVWRNNQLWTTMIRNRTTIIKMISKTMSTSRLVPLGKQAKLRGHLRRMWSSFSSSSVLVLKNGQWFPNTFHRELESSAESDGTTTWIQRSRNAAGAKRKSGSCSWCTGSSTTSGPKSPKSWKEGPTIPSKITGIVQWRESSETWLRHSSSTCLEC